MHLRILRQEVNEDAKEGLPVFSLSCGHEFTDEQWQAHLKRKIDKACSCEVNCLQMKCNMKMPHTLILEKLAQDESLVNKYWRNLTKSFADEDPQIKVCWNQNFKHRPSAHSF